MPRKPMFWLKLHTKGWLRGSIRFDLTPAERSVFLDLVAMARESRNPPWVQANETTHYPHSWLASTLNIPLELLEQTLVKCKQEPDPRIFEDEHGIYIVNFGQYQDETSPRLVSQGKNIYAVYSEEIGELTLMAAERLKDLEGRHSQEDIIDAIREAVKANVRKLAYIEKILENWARDGKSKDEPEDARLSRYGGRAGLIAQIYRAKTAKGEAWSADSARGKPAEYLLELAEELGLDGEP